MTVNKTNKLIPKKNNSNNFLSIKKILNAVTAININSVIINDLNSFIIISFNNLPIFLSPKFPQLRPMKIRYIPAPI